MGVPQARWMVYDLENPKITWMIWGHPYDLGNLRINHMS